MEVASIEHADDLNVQDVEANVYFQFLERYKYYGKLMLSISCSINTGGIEKSPGDVCKIEEVYIPNNGLTDCTTNKLARGGTIEILESFIRGRLCGRFISRSILLDVDKLSFLLR